MELLGRLARPKMLTLSYERLELSQAKSQVFETCNRVLHGEGHIGRGSHSNIQQRYSKELRERSAGSASKLATALKYRVEDRKLLAEHHIVVDSLEFGDKTASKDAAPMQMLQPDQVQLEALGRTRAQVVQEAILANPAVDPQRIFVTTDRPGEATAAGTVRMELKLE